MTEKVGLLGWPVEHSVSPPMHNAVFKALELDWRYELLPVEPENLNRRVAELLADGYRGVNVTVPHKKAVLDLLQISEVDPAVEEMGAANTLTVLPDGRLKASNTDWRGFANDLLAHGGESALNRHCLILGTGGSAQGVAYALRQMEALSVTFVSRKPGVRPDTITYDAMALREDMLLVNCTPVGMSPNVEASPWPEGVNFPKDAILYDLIYNPPVTRLMAQAQAAGVYTIGGLGMLVRQGALAFEMWTGITPPVAIMETAAQRALARSG